LTLPVRVNFTGTLPFDLSAYLNSITYSVWQSGDPYEPIAQQLLAAIQRHAALPHAVAPEDPAALQALAAATEAVGVPLPAADPRFWRETGAVRMESPFYVRRAVDAEMEELVQRRGETIIVKAPRQFGKSSLLARAAASAQENQQQVFYLDFQLLDEAVLASLDSLLRYLASKLAREFKTQLKPNEFWDASLGAKDNLTDFLEEALLAKAAAPYLLLFDEVDHLFKRAYRDDFFATLRGWHNLRARKPEWNQLNLTLAHSTEPHLWIQDFTQSPFNVGVPLTLNAFDNEQVAALNAKYGQPLRTAQEVSALCELLGGHPFIVRQALYMLVDQRWSLAQLVAEARHDSGPFGDHLRRLLWFLQNNERLKQAVQQILARGECEDELLFQNLNAAGLVRGDTRDAVQMRCELYRDYFSKHL
jgi:hypothetical protein